MVRRVNNINNQCYCLAIVTITFALVMLYVFNFRRKPTAVRISRRELYDIISRAHKRALTGNLGVV